MRSPPADCLFIHVPRWEAARREIMVMPLGFPALANLIADETGQEPAILHLGIEREADSDFSLRSALSAHPPRLIFLSLHWYLQTRAVVDAAKQLRSWFPESTIVVGGLTATVFARELLELRFIDAVVCGDGEASVLSLVRTVLGEPASNARTPRVRQMLHEVPNLLWRDEAGVLHENTSRYCLGEVDAAKLRHGSLRLLRNRQAYLDRVLYADFSEGAREPGYARAAYLNGGRGCSVNCVNCGGGAAAQAALCGRRGVLLYPLHKLVRDVEEAVAEGVQVLRMSFDPPAARRSLRAWFDALQGVGQPLRLVYDLWHLPSADLLDSMGKVFEPGSTLILSPECGSEQVRQRMRGLPFSNEQMLGSIREIESRGFRAHCFFSAGLPTETPEDIDASLALIDRIRNETSAGISVCPMVADPGSPLFQDPEAFGARLTRKSLRDFYDEKGLPNGPGYETRFFTEREIVAACSRLLKAAGLPGLGSQDESSGPRVQRALPTDTSDSKRLLLLVGSFRSLVPEGTDGPFGSQGGFVDNLAPAPYSLANGYLKAWVETFADVRSRWELRLLNLAEPLELEDDREEVVLSEQQVERLVAQAPHMIAFSTYCWNVDAILRASGEIKKRLPSVRILLGGRATEGDPRELLASCPGIDAVVVGEGELPFLEILRGDSFDGIPGVVARSGEEILCGGPPQSIQSLDEIPSPFLSGVIAPATHAVMLEFSRGCLHACGYCTWNSDKHLRYFGAERIEREVAWARDQGHRHITMNDSALNYDTAQLRKFVEAVRRGDPSGTVQFTYNLRHDALSDDQIGILSKLPTHMALMGIETLAPRGMELIDRAGVDASLLRDRLHAFAHAVRSPVASIVLGLPNDDERGFLETLETLMAWTVPDETGVRPVGTVLVSLLQVYRGSKLWQRREELGLRFCTTGIPYLIESPSWPAPSLARCKAEIIRRIAMDPERLKAAEALVLMDGVRPAWLSRRILGIVLRDWPEGREHDGWTLERIGFMRDTGQGALLRFRRRDGGSARVRLTLDEDAVRAQRPGRFRIGVHALPGPLVPDALLKRLGQLVQAVVRRGEHYAAAVVARDEPRRSNL
jgi:radical SAM superfamily enzyme YgiQ (UPF0313 family)